MNSYKKKKGVVLLVVAAMTFMATLDSSIVNVALPVMANELDVSISQISWIVASYSLIICATLLFFGRLGDIKGKSKIFQMGTVIFTGASLLCGISNSFYLLIICRFIQGIGASAYMANNHGIIAELFSPQKRGKALGILITSVAIGNMFGPSIGGVILSLWNWNAIFFINVPIGIVVFILGTIFLPNDVQKSECIDKIGAILQFAGTTLLFGSLIIAQQLGLQNPYVLAALLLALVFIVLFVCHEKRQKQPLLDIGIFKNADFSANLFCALTAFVCIAASSIMIPFYLQNTLKLYPIQAGIFMMISPLTLAVASPVFGNLSDKVEKEKVILCGLIFISVGFYLMSQLNEYSPVIACAIFVCIIALGQAIFQPANNALIMSSCTKSKLGIVGSVNSLVRNLGQIIGITMSTTLLYNFMSQKAGYRVYDYIDGNDYIFVYGMRKVYLILVGICLVGAFLIGFRVVKCNKQKKEGTSNADKQKIS